jgi:hypothetical protein
MVDFFIRNGELIISSQISGGDVYAGRVYGVDVIKVLIIPNTQDGIVLLDYLQALDLKKSNLIRIDEIGKIQWVVGPPEKQGSNGLPRDDIISYTDFYFQKDLLFAYDYSGFSDQINIETGSINNSKFVK